ncbi:hypothetical protein K458DRAFT_457032 [Lentithecium fluviatile CBS 122367]|uniref:Uncharacterized protein n=1 Tax=Lentithecium fluviatile CBS 122367 TaxID=1168545 RepID=A0A6G1ITZ3_9PLEO|nr:hypothetical protein K458DRAFT_457032 [Lentithecium fluviatile CBS 122367]
MPFHGEMRGLGVVAYRAVQIGIPSKLYMTLLRPMESLKCMSVRRPVTAPSGVTGARTAEFRATRLQPEFSEIVVVMRARTGLGETASMWRSVARPSSSRPRRIICFLTGGIERILGGEDGDEGLLHTNLGLIWVQQARIPCLYGLQLPGQLSVNFITLRTETYWLFCFLCQERFI